MSPTGERSNLHRTIWRVANDLRHPVAGIQGSQQLDDTFYIEHAADFETCRRVFHSIFNLMGQEQHYNMMMHQTTDFIAPSKPVGAQQTTIPSPQEEATQ